MLLVLQENLSTWPTRQSRDQHAQQKSSNVRPHRYASARGHGIWAQHINRGQKLKQKPDAEHEIRRYGHQENKDQREDAFTGKEHSVGAHHPRDGSAGADRGHGGAPVEDDVQQAGTYTAKKIKEQIRQMAEVVLDIVAEHPQEEHVAGDVQQAAVQE